MQIPKRFLTRAKPALRRYQKILASARDRDVNESDTSVIVSDILCDVLGYDKYEEVTREYAIRSTYCDLAVKIGSALRFLIEVKAIGKTLQDNHLRQAVDYGANEGVEWVLLTNGVEWQAHRIRFERPIAHDLMFSIDLLAGHPPEIVEHLYLLSREASKTHAIEAFRRQQEVLNRFVLAQLLLSDPILSVLRREVRKISSDVKVSVDDLGDMIRADVLKREAVEGEQAKEAASLVRKAAKRRARQSASQSPVDKPQDQDGTG